MRKYLFAVAIVLSGCATVGTPLAPEITRLNFPDVGENASVRIGESMLKKAKVYEYDAIQLDEEFKAGDGLFLQQVRLPPQKLKAKSILKNNTLYIAEEAYSKDAILGERPIIAGLCIPKDSEKTKWRIYMNGQCTALGKSDLPSHSFSTAYDTDKPSLTREMIYNGRVGNEIKVIYRELSNDRMRPAFQQDLQYDLSSSNEIAFREVVLEVLNADNRQIQYLVISHFEDLE